MGPLSFWQSLNPIRIWRGARCIAGIHSTANFKDIIGRERARTNRTGVHFSLVVFKLEGPKSETYQALQHLARSLVSRARTSDEVGWLDKALLCALLVGAGEAGARKFGTTILGSFPQGLIPPTFEVFVYQGTGKDAADGRTERGETPLSVDALDSPRQPSLRKPRWNPGRKTRSMSSRLYLPANFPSGKTSWTSSPHWSP